MACPRPLTGVAADPYDYDYNEYGYDSDYAYQGESEYDDDDSWWNYLFGDYDGEDESELVSFLSLPPSLPPPCVCVCVRARAPGDKHERPLSTGRDNLGVGGSGETEGERESL